MDYKNNNYKKNNTRRYSGQQTIGIALEQFTKPIMRQRGIVNSRIITDWPSIVGDYLAKQSLPKKITFPKGQNVQGTLFIEVFHSGLATELEYLKEEIKEKIATFYGFMSVSNIKIVQSPKPVNSVIDNNEPFYKKELKTHNALSKKTEYAINSINDEDLRNKLISLSDNI